MEVFIEKYRILCLQRLTLATLNSNLEVARLASLLAFDSSEAVTLFL